MAVQALALVCLPLGWCLFGRLPDRGYFVTKTFGILLHSLLLWLGVSYGLLRNETGGAVLAFMATAALALYWGRAALRPGADGQSMGRWLRGHVVLVLVAEGVFLAAFAFWALVRAHNPAADHTEQPMDLLFLSGIHTSPEFPPRDPWLAGHAIGYYYFGHWMLNALGLLSGQPPETAYNLGQACWYGLLLSGSFGMGFNLVSLRVPTGWGSAFAGGLLAAVTVGMAGNPQGVLDVLQRRGLALSFLARGRAAHNFEAPSAHWWWWRSGRVLQDRDFADRPVEVIDEFPAFSYVVGDDHPHLLAMPFALLVLALALNTLLARREAEGAPVGVWPRLLALFPLGGRGLALTIAAVGALLFLNTWDFPVYWLVMVLAVFGAAREESGGRAWLPALLFGVAGAGGSFLLYTPFLLSAQSQAQGLSLNLFHPTPLFQLLLMCGVLLLGLVLLLVIVWGPHKPALRQVAWSAGAALGLPALVLVVGALAAGRTEAGEAVTLMVQRRLDHPWTLLVLGGLVALVLACLWRSIRESSGAASDRFALILAGIGALLLLVPEVLYVQDGFGTRMNTVFKLYYQAWLLLGLAGAYAIVVSLRRGGRVRWLGAVTLGLIAMGVMYTGAAVYSVAEGFRAASPTLDALAYLRTAAPDELAAIEWVRRHTPPHAVVLQGSGRSYAPDQCRLSVATGRPTLMGWEGHEVQWRGRDFATMSQGRSEALEAVYRGADADALRQVLETWRIDYVFVGPAERLQYGVDEAGEARLAGALDLVFAEGTVRIFRRRPVGGRSS